MRGDRLFRDCFNAKRSYLRQFVENIEIGETLWVREISDRTGIPRTKVYRLMAMLEERGAVKWIPFVWPEPPEGFEMWGKVRRVKWRQSVKGIERGYPGDKWRFLGFTVTPVDELLNLAQLDLNARRRPS